jgi:hypothetical protein
LRTKSRRRCLTERQSLTISSLDMPHSSGSASDHFLLGRAGSPPLPSFYRPARGSRRGRVAVAKSMGVTGDIPERLDGLLCPRSASTPHHGPLRPAPHGPFNSAPKADSMGYRRARQSGAEGKPPCTREDSGVNHYNLNKSNEVSEFRRSVSAIFLKRSLPCLRRQPTKEPMGPNSAVPERRGRAVVVTRQCSPLVILPRNGSLSIS